MQIREARKLEQSHNPNYLKPTESSKRQVIGDECENIPIAEIALEVPLIITCKFINYYLIKIQIDSKIFVFFSATKRSDKYLNSENDTTRHSKKKNKKSKKNSKKSKHRADSNSDSDEEGKTSSNPKYKFFNEQYNNSNLFIFTF